MDVVVHHVAEYETEQLIPVFIAGLKDNYHLAQENGAAGLRRLQEKDRRSSEVVSKALRAAGIKYLSGEKVLAGETSAGD